MGWSLPAQVGASRAPLEAFENREAAYQFRDPMDMSYICHMMSIIVSTSFIVQLEDVFHVITSRELVWNMEGKCLSAHTQQSQCHTSKQEVLNFQALRSDFVVLRAVFTMINENALWRISTPSCLHLKSPSDQIRHTPALQAFCAALSKAWDSGGTYQQHPATTKQTKPFEVPRWSQVIPGDPRWLLGWPTILRYFGSKVKMVKSQFTNLFGVETPWMCSFAENGENGEKEAQDSSPWSLPHREVLNRLSILPSMLVHGLMQPRSSRTWGLWCHVWWRTGGGLETLETSWWILS
jgi:hypothetical protein